MLSFSLGPVALPVLPVLVIVALYLASWGAQTGLRWYAHRQQLVIDPAEPMQAGNTIWWAAGLGALAARVAQVLQHADLYLSGPPLHAIWAVLDVRDAGWHLPSGMAVAMGWMLWTLWRHPLWRLPVGGAWLGSAALAGGLALALGVGRPPELPALDLWTLDTPPQRQKLPPRSDRPRVINLWASWCGPCRAEMPLLAAAQQQHRDIDFVFINQGESAAVISAYLNDQALTLHGVLRDPQAQWGLALGSSGLPTTLFYDAQGRLLARHMGVLTPVALHTRLRELQP